MTNADADPVRSVARVSVGLSSAAIASALLGWIAFAGGIVLSDHFNSSDPRGPALILAWMALGAVSLGAWIGGCVTAGMASTRARGVNRSGAANVPIAMAALVPFTWALEWGACVLWFGFEALSGPLVV